MANLITVETVTQLMTVIGCLAFVVSVVTEVIKNLGAMKYVPTDLAVIVLSIAFTVVALIAYAQYAAIALTWYWIVAAVVCSFFVAFIAMFGWDKLNELWNRFSNK